MTQGHACLKTNKPAKRGHFINRTITLITMNPIKSAFKTVAWKRTFVISAVFGLLTTFSAPKQDIQDFAPGYFLGATGAYALLLGSACAGCAKSSKTVTETA